MKEFIYNTSENVPKDNKHYYDVLYNATAIAFRGRPNPQTSIVVKDGVRFYKNDDDDEFLFKVSDRHLSIYDKEGKLKLYNVTINW